MTLDSKYEHQIEIGGRNHVFDQIAENMLALLLEAIIKG
jgi:hypothetical protein